ncbi:MAG: sarcosine oxidase subunit gamma [Stappia sp.]|uniref:sarcosine oxidase subunit gamma n=1 Tax=Stappia sp. TaxID=1870903 RepID=UPI000C35F41D|nr:sarcosine oxidase subunit gamma family protein [Stappia sp.]MAB00793.1 sarcosine oxidase subunit gamma [Stappia sp.]MBM22545.1 sarcosine oxidase subunit gamma [Stappia sp.]
MSDNAIHVSAGDAPLVDRSAEGGKPVTVRRGMALARLAFRGDAVAAGKAGAAFGASLPLHPLAANCVGDRAALWLGPDEWLLLARPEGSEPANLDALARETFAGIEAALEGVTHSLVDVSERNVSLMIEGAGAADLLNANVFLDLSLEAFPVGHVTRTLFSKAEIVLWRTGEESFVLECWASFAPYVEGHLAEAA